MSQDSITKTINDANINSVREQIKLKKDDNPYFSTMNDAESVITDMDHFPYTRFFRGVYHSSDPVVFEREAGWRPPRDECYRGCYYYNPEYPDHCFETACSTVFPCYPKYLTKYSDRDAMNVQLNRSCIVQYR
jgi:hypothetical protein